LIARLVEHSNASIRSFEESAGHRILRSTDDLPWAAALRADHERIAEEWRDRAAAGLRLPLIEQVIDEDQEADGQWRIGLLYAHGSPVTAVARSFPRTAEALGGVPGLRAAMWSLLEPGTELGEHVGYNHGVLRYHLGIDCGVGSALTVGEYVVRYRDGHDVLFDDTWPHAASNRGPRARVTLFLEVLKPLPPRLHRQNRMVQDLIARDPRYRRASRRAAEWHRALNPRLG
jgi:beta-hydroxylase